MFGMNVVSTQMAREVRTEWRVERHPTKKRRLTLEVSGCEAVRSNEMLGTNRRRHGLGR